MSKKPNGMNGHGKVGHNSGSVWLRRSYNFIDKDPEIDRFRTLWQKERIKEADLAVMAGLATTTVSNMFGGETRRPQHATFAKMAGAMGYEYGLTRKKEPDYEKEIPKAKEQFKDYRSKQRKRKGK
jgi:transcriptional regulator with XRE-family HTH domain